MSCPKEIKEECRKTYRPFEHNCRFDAEGMETHCLAYRSIMLKLHPVLAPLQHEYYPRKLVRA